jgi:hypothetical protein
MHRSVFSCLGFKPIPLAGAEDGERFVNALINAKAINKKPKPEV